MAIHSVSNISHNFRHLHFQTGFKFYHHERNKFQNFARHTRKHKQFRHFRVPSYVHYTRNSNNNEEIIINKSRERDLYQQFHSIARSGYFTTAIPDLRRNIPFTSLIRIPFDFHRGVAFCNCGGNGHGEQQNATNYDVHFDANHL